MNLKGRWKQELFFFFFFFCFIWNVCFERKWGNIYRPHRRGLPSSFVTRSPHGERKASASSGESLLDAISSALQPRVCFQWQALDCFELSDNFPFHEMFADLPSEIWPDVLKLLFKLQICNRPCVFFIQKFCQQVKFCVVDWNIQIQKPCANEKPNLALEFISAGMHCESFNWQCSNSSLFSAHIYRPWSHQRGRTHLLRDRTLWVVLLFRLRLKAAILPQHPEIENKELRNFLLCHNPFPAEPKISTNHSWRNKEPSIRFQFSILFVSDLENAFSKQTNFFSAALSLLDLTFFFPFLEGLDRLQQGPWLP